MYHKPVKNLMLLLLLLFIERTGQKSKSLLTFISERCIITLRNMGIFGNLLYKKENIMKHSNKKILTFITASLLLLSTGCSQSAEAENIITDSTTVTTISAETEAPKEATSVTTVQTTAPITTAAATTVITTVPVTETQPVTQQAETEEAPIITTTTTNAPPVVVTTTTTTPVPQKEEPEDRSYLNLSPAEVQSILDECERYAKSIGFRVMTYSEFVKAEKEYEEKQFDNSKTEEEIEKIRNEWNSDLKYISDYDCEEFWSTGWHNIAFAGNFDLVKGGDTGGYWLCKTKQESIDWLLGYLKFYIKMDYNEERFSGAIATPLKTFDQMAKDGKCIFSYDVLHSYYASYMVYDINTSYAFCVKWY